MNLEKLQKAGEMILDALGEDLTREGLRETPRRFAEMFRELCSGYADDQSFSEKCTTFSGESYEEMIVVRDIHFYSLCEHHLLPILGKVSVGYIPENRIVGLSKIPRLVQLFARRLQNQERLTVQIADTLLKILQPKGVAVHISALHLCMSMRGVRSENAKTETSVLRGVFHSDVRTRSEFLSLMRSSEE